MTERRTVEIPSYILKSGETKTNAGTASTSASSSRVETDSAGSGRNSGSVSGGSSTSSAKKSQSILYGVASGLKLI